jgi:1-aminocyclopropane-1-carboxylate synthase
LWSKAPTELYHSVNNPDGLAVLSGAENILTVDVLTKRMLDVPQVPQEVCMYGSSFGLRASVARLFERTFFKGRKLNPNNFVITNGAGPAISMLLFSICNPGDGVIVPSPYYPGFDMDIKALASAIPVPAHFSGDNNFKFDIAAIQRAYDKATKDNITVKSILITSPSNPLGQILTKEELTAVLQWAVDHEVHLIMDEIYALSCFGGDFVSISDILLEKREEFGKLVHVVWSFSKDFDVSGFRVGLIYSENQELLGTLRDQSYFHFSSNLAQYYLSNIINDEVFVDNFFTTNLQNLRDAYNVCTAQLDKYGISYIAGNAGFFIMLDFRKCLSALTYDAETVFWKKLIDEAKVMLIPGSAMHTEPGWFRCCYTALHIESLKFILERLGRYISANYKHIK